MRVSAVAGILFIFLAIEHPGGCDIWKTFREMQLKNKVSDHGQMNPRNWMEIGSMPVCQGKVSYYTLGFVAFADIYTPAKAKLWA